MQVPKFLRRRDRPDPTIDGVLVMRRGRPYDPAWDRWRPTRRWPGVLLSALATAALVTAIAYHYERHASAATKPPFKGHSHVVISPTYMPPLPAHGTGVESFTGTGRNFSGFDRKFTSPGGLSLWEFQCLKCQDNFIVTVHNSLGTIIGVPVNSIGATTTTAAVVYPPGNYSFDVVSGTVGKPGAPWSAKLVDEADLRPMKTPFSYISSGPSVLGPISPKSDKLTLAYAETLGQLFTVQVVDVHGDILDNVVATIHNDSTTVVIPHLPNPYFLEVNGAGLWLVDVS